MTGAAWVILLLGCILVASVVIGAGLLLSGDDEGPVSCREDDIPAAGAPRDGAAAESREGGRCRACDGDLDTLGRGSLGYCDFCWDWVS